MKVCATVAHGLRSGVAGILRRGGQDPFAAVLLGGGSLLALLAIAAVPFADRTSLRVPRDPTSPVAVVTGFIIALGAGSATGAYLLLTDDLQDEIDDWDAYAARASKLFADVWDHRLLVKPVGLGPTTATVEVKIRKSHSLQEYQGHYYHGVPYYLVQQGGEWRINGVGD